MPSICMVINLFQNAKILGKKYSELFIQSYFPVIFIVLLQKIVPKTGIICLAEIVARCSKLLFRINWIIGVCSLNLGRIDPLVQENKTLFAISFFG